jgi:hypothetical protein
MPRDGLPAIFVEMAENPAAAFILMTPLPWRGVRQAITEGINIRRLDPPERAALESSDALLSHHDLDAAARDGWWLCYEFENSYSPDNVRYGQRQAAAFKLLLHAMYTVQILMPIGAANLLLLYRRTEGGLRLDSSQRRHVFTGTAWGRRCDVPVSFGADAPVVLDRVHEVFQKPTLRLQIPVWLLEQGLIAEDRHIRILLWTTGLDAVTRSGGIAAFADKLCGLLGPGTEVFPPGAEHGTPPFKVSDVVEDLFRLRTEMAHGLPFHEKFRKKRAFLSNGACPEFANCRYDQVLEECAGFLLCRALREVLLRDNADAV